MGNGTESKGFCLMFAAVVSASVAFAMLMVMVVTVNVRIEAEAVVKK